MATQIGPLEALFVDLPRGRELLEKLRAASELIASQDPCDVVLDFSRVTTFNSVCLTTLLWLRQQLQDHGRRLILCNVGTAAYTIFYITGLTRMFEITDNRSAALTAIGGPSPTTRP